MDKIKRIIRKLLVKDVILYILFGVLTTIVNFVAFYIMANILKWNENVSNIIAIFVAVILAYLTNKDMVFHSNANTLDKKLKEFIKFMAGRAFTMIVEFVGGYILFKFPIPNIISKGIITVLVVILNFFISKYFAFK
ncbi:MAG: GtrA family protein [Clostridia bacterium]|nr:GtrA family protein [Clostridia bacterium]MBR3255720.1 GtrA family protein [Clostridia bacterium]